MSIKSECKKKLNGSTTDMVSEITNQLKESGYSDILVLPSKLPDGQFVSFRKEDGTSPAAALVSAMVGDHNAEIYVKEVKDFRESVRLFPDNPAASSLHGTPAVWDLQRIQALNESFVDKDGDSVTIVFVATKKSLRHVKSKGGHPLEAVARAGKLYNPEAIILSNGGYERSIVPPGDRTGVELVQTALIAPDGATLMLLSRGYTREGNEVIWQPDTKQQLFGTGKNALYMQTRIPLAWRGQTSKAA